MRVQDLYQYKMMDKKWKTMSGDKVHQIHAAIQDACRPGHKHVMIGTDSQAGERGLKYVTVVVVYTPGKGGRVFYTEQYVEPARSLREKLVGEAFLSAYTALETQTFVPDNCDISVHLDVNSDTKKGLSAKHRAECEGIVKGFQFSVFSKPESWAATWVAEHLVKGRHTGKSRAA